MALMYILWTGLYLQILLNITPFLFYFVPILERRRLLVINKYAPVFGRSASNLGGVFSSLMSTNMQNVIWAHKAFFTCLSLYGLYGSSIIST